LGNGALNRTARIVVLNGVGCAGKSSIARALQTLTAEPYLHVAMDSFLEMLPEAMQDHPDTFLYETSQEDGHPSIDIKTGPVGERVMKGMRHAVAALAAQGNNLILDEVMMAPDWAEYAPLLAGFDVALVGVFAPLEVLEARERQRGDRLIGTSRGQYGRLHQGMTYDLEVDTSHATPMECARLIKQRFGL
jgi:chloramphenicol 3-O phosphotransferase